MLLFRDFLKGRKPIEVLAKLLENLTFITHKANDVIFKALY